MAIHQQGNALVCVGSFLASGGAATGLTVSVDVYELGLPSGTPTTIVTAASATEIARGLYYYRLAGVNVDANALYVFAFYTLGAADQKVVVQGWTAGVGWVENVNATVGSRATQTSVDAVKAKTDQLTFTAAGKVDATIQAAADFAQAAADKVWLSAARTLTAFSFAVDVSVGAVASIVSGVWAAGSRTLTSAVDISAAAVQAVWDAATSALTTAGSIGKYVVDQLAVAGADPLASQVPGSYPSGSAGAALGRIGTAAVTIVSPLSADGQEMTLVRGDDYSGADAFDFIDADGMWFEPLAEATWTIRTGGTVELTKAMTIVTASGPGKQVRLELTAAETEQFQLGKPAYRFDVQLTAADGREKTPVRGVMHVLEDQTHA